MVKNFIKSQSRVGKLIFVGDEATVHMLKSRNKRIRNLVRRKEELRYRGHIPTRMAFGKFRHEFDSGQEEKHWFKYHSLRLAWLLHPQNFIEPRAITFEKENGKKYSVTYSIFVPDKLGVRKRRRKFMNSYRRDPEHRFELKERFDDQERALHPEIDELSEKFSESGIIVPHPHLNYHAVRTSKEKNIVFMEVMDLNFYKALQAAQALTPQKKKLALLHLSGAYSAFLSSMARQSLGEQKYADLFEKIPHPYLTQLVFERMKNPFPLRPSIGTHSLQKNFDMLIGRNPSEKTRYMLGKIHSSLASSNPTEANLLLKKYSSFIQGT